MTGTEKLVQGGWQAWARMLGGVEALLISCALELQSSPAPPSFSMGGEDPEGNMTTRRLAHFDPVGLPIGADI